MGCERCTIGFERLQKISKRKDSGDNHLVLGPTENVVRRDSPYTRLIQTSVILWLIQGTYLLHTPERTFEVVDERSRRERVRTIRGNARSEEDIMVNRRLFFGRVCKVRFLRMC
jgi:hypothetical protein